MADLPPPSAAALPPDDGGDDGSPPPPSPDGDGPPPLPGPPRQISEEDLRWYQSEASSIHIQPQDSQLKCGTALQINSS